MIVRNGRLINIAYLQFFLFSGIVASCQTDTPNTNKVKNLVEQSSSSEQMISSVKVDSIKYIYSWKDQYRATQSLINNIKPPDGFNRVNSDRKSFGSWLIHLPLSDDNTVYLYNGDEKGYQASQFKVLDIDVGKRDLQQCADAVMRLRAEYLFATNQFDKIHFKYTNGVNIPFSKWSKGFHPSLKGNKVVWTSSANNSSYKSFKKYLINVFMYAGTASLEKEMKAIDLSEIQSGDVFIKGGFPGHAVIVLDVVANEGNGDKAFILAQSYMPAQSIHILRNPKNVRISPWYSLKEITNVIETPEWTFRTNQLKRFVE
jgi:hypothetical protein